MQHALLNFVILKTKQNKNKITQTVSRKETDSAKLPQDLKQKSKFRLGLLHGDVLLELRSLQSY